MKTSTSLMAGASRFAHFAGLTRSSARRQAAEDDDDQPKGKRSRRAAEDDDDGDDDEPKGKGSRRAADDDDDGDEPKGKGSRRAADDDDDEPKGKGSRRASDDDDDDGDDEPKGKGSRRASDDDDGDDDEPKGKRSRQAAEDDEDEDDEEELNGRSSASRARRREQARIAHILGHRAAANNPALAVSLACETRMSRRAAVQVLKGQTGQEPGDRPRGSRQSRADRNVRLGSDAAPTGRQATDASWGAAFAKAGVPVSRR